MLPLTVVGICSYHPAVHRWFGTLREHFDGPCVLYLTNSDPELPAQLATRYNATVVPTHVSDDFWKLKPVGFMCGQWDCVRDACMARVRDGWVLRTDPWDVVFQDDPRRYIDPASHKIAVCHEGARLDGEPINSVWLGDWLWAFGASPVVNGGLICGPARSLAVLATLISRSALGTPADQSELELLAAAFPDSFEHRPLFLECMYQSFDHRGVVREGRVCDRASGRPWCVVHANGGMHTDLFESLFPLSRYQPV